MKIKIFIFLSVFFAAVAGYIGFIYMQQQRRFDLVENWNYDSAHGPNIYQWLARSFVFVIKRPAIIEPSNHAMAEWGWDSGEAYGLFVIERGSKKTVCRSFSGITLGGSSVDLEPYVGKAVLITGFDMKENDSFHIEHLELDHATNARLAEYRQACPLPFQRMAEVVGASQ